MGLENLHAVRPQIVVDWIRWIFEVGELARASRTVFATGGGESLGDAVVAERTFLGDLLGRMDEATTVWTRLNAVSATETIGGIDEHGSLRRIEGGANRANLRAG